LKRTPEVVLAACAAAATSVVVGFGPAQASSHGSKGDRATGAATNQYPTPAGPGQSKLGVFARSGPGGLDPRGIVRAQGTTGTPMGEFKVSGAVTCLRVDGNRAAIKYRFDKATGSAAPFQGGGVEVFVEDNGHARKGQPVDRNAFEPPQPAGAFDAAAAQCDDPNTAPYDTVTSGDYSVRAGRVAHTH
jgi:hypothetical protein